MRIGMKMFGWLFVMMMMMLVDFYVQSRSVRSIDNFVKPSLYDCNRFLNTSDCYYFSCIDSIYQCGEGNILVQFSYSLCEATLERVYSSLTQSGQLWAVSTQKCLMNEINYLLNNHPPMTCSVLDRIILDMYPLCLTQSDNLRSICSIICANLDIFISIFDGWNIKGLNIKRILVQTSRLCQEQQQHHQMEYVINLQEANVKTILWSLCLDSPVVNFEGIDPSRIMMNGNRLASIFSDQD